MTGAIVDPMAIKNELLLSYCVFKFICIKLGEALLHSHISYSAACADGHDDLASVNPDQCTLGYCA